MPQSPAKSNPWRIRRFALAIYVARQDLSRRYADSVLGPVLALAYPAMLIAVYAAVFSLFPSLHPRGDIAFPAMLIAGMVSWFALSDATTSMTSSLSANAAMVKRIIMPVEVLPLAALISAVIIHLLLLLVAVMALWLMGHPPGVHLLAIVYAMACLIALALPIGMVLALINTALRDVAFLVSPVLQLWFWATPIIWPATALPHHLSWIATINPFAHVVAAYRFALLGPHTQMIDATAAAWFWGLAALMAVLARWAFKRFRAELADNL
ncbi:MAG: ABC transporter permease [Sphingopyxis sp.]